MVTFPQPDEIPDEEFENPHPAVVLQNDNDNHQRETTIVVPLTSGSNPDPLDEVLLTPSEDGVQNDSLAQLHMITAVSVPGRIFDGGGSPSAWKLGEASPKVMNEIENKLSLILSF